MQEFKAVAYDMVTVFSKLICRPIFVATEVKIIRSNLILYE